jgi:glycosyltransferase involved in cell wall biosynthesis
VRSEVARLGLEQRVAFHGSVPYLDIPARYRAVFALVSASKTGSVDKVVLEAMACRRPVVTCNDAFPHVFAALGADAERLTFPQGDGRALADRVQALLSMNAPERTALGGRLRDLVRRDHEVDALMGRLCELMGAPR